MDNTTQPKTELTLGEKRCHINFNPSSDDKIGQFKRMMADAIDFCFLEQSLSSRSPLDAEETMEQII